MAGEKKIFIAEDDQHFCELYQMALGIEGYNVLCAYNGKDALDRIPQENPDLVILDVMMPEMDGYEVCRRLRELPDFALTPIIMLTALATDDDKIKGYNVGADDYLTKPFPLRVLKAKVRSLIERKNIKKTAQAKPEVNVGVPQPTITQEVVKEQPTVIREVTAAVPAEPRTPVRTIDSEENLFKSLFGGKIPEGSNIFVIGQIGSGKSSLSRLFLAQGIKKKEKCMFICLDDDPSLVRKDLSKHNLDISAHENQNQVCLVDAYSWSGGRAASTEKFAIKGTLDLSDLSTLIVEAGAVLGQTDQEKEGGRRVIDSISSLFLNFDLPYVQRFLAFMARSGHFARVSTIFVVEEGACDSQSLNNIKYIMDGILDIKREGDRFLARPQAMKWAVAKTDWTDITQERSI
ncbi:MAG: response regulator [Deltaproteobacteria bacterium]|nr:response regulator [Deltaproteobacteria bacterium]